jgi:hypothetical protein
VKAPKLPKDPIDGYTLEWWTFEPCDSWCPGIRRHLAIFILNSTWDEVMSRPELKRFHCNKPGEVAGAAPFENDWMIINEQGSTGEMRFDGRACGWGTFNEPRGGIGKVYSADERWADSYATPQEALVAFKEHAKQWIAYREEQLARGRDAVGRVADDILRYIEMHKNNPAPSL